MAYRIIAIILILAAILYDTLLKNKDESKKLEETKETYNTFLDKIFKKKVPKNCDKIITDSNLAEKLKLGSVQNLHPSMYSWDNYDSNYNWLQNYPNKQLTTRAGH